MTSAASGKLAQEVLRRVGRVRGASGPFERRTVIIATAVVVTLGIVVTAFYPDQPAAKAATAVAALATLIYGYLQWRSGRHEASYDKYYDRLEVSNRRLDILRLEQHKRDAEATERHMHNMYVFVELDNLEFILGKYRFRFIRPDLACRAVRSFASRCQDQRFREEAVHWVNDLRTGYDVYTLNAVELITSTVAQRK